MDIKEEPDKTFSRQRQRLTPSLFELLLEARQLTPAGDGRFLDFDMFSNTQLATYGTTVKVYSAKQDNSIHAEVVVDVGLRGDSSGTPQRLLYELNNSEGGWRINDITYFFAKVFELRPFLQKLVLPIP